MDTSRPTLAIAAIVAGFVISLVGAGAVQATHQNLYQATMTPPSHPDGLVSYNSCGWHSGACTLNLNGPAQDWGYHNDINQDDYTVRFRGWLYRSSTSYSNSYLILDLFQRTQGPTVCNEAVANVIEIAPWVVRYGMHYLHSNYWMGGGQALYVSGSGIGAWNSVTAAYMTADAGCPPCPPTGCASGYGFHTHAWAIPASLTYYEENRSVYQCCNYGGGLFPNNLENYRTHRIQFQQGHY